MIGTTDASGVCWQVIVDRGRFGHGLSISHFPAFGSCSVTMSVVLGFYFRAHLRAAFQQSLEYLVYETQPNAEVEG